MLFGCDGRREEVRRSIHLGLLEVVADLLHEGGVVSPLHLELSLLKVKAAAARLALAVHSAIYEWAMHAGGGGSLIHQQHQFKQMLTHNSQKPSEFHALFT